MKILSIVLMTVLYLSLHTVHAEEITAESSASDKLAEQLAKLNSYQASFQQTVAEEDGYILDENTGVMSFERPSKLYWNVLTPFPNTLVSDGEKVYFYDPDLDQVTIRNWSSNPSENPIAVFVGGAVISDYYDVQLRENSFILQPHNLESGYSDIRIQFDKTDALKNMTCLLYTSDAADE